MNTVVRGLLVLALAAGVLGFGAIGLCGGFFTAMFVPELGTHAGASSMPFLALSLPCLIGGFFMVWVCMRKILRTLRSRQTEEAS